MALTSKKATAATLQASPKAQNNVNLAGYKLVSELYNLINAKFTDKSLISAPITKQNIDEAVNKLAAFKHNSEVLVSLNAKLTEKGFDAVNASNILELVDQFHADRINLTLFNEINEEIYNIGLDDGINQSNLNASIDTLTFNRAKAEVFDEATLPFNFRSAGKSFTEIGAIVKGALSHIAEYCAPKHGANDKLCIDICNDGFHFDTSWTDCS